MPAAEVFFDSNILIYALSDAPDERTKHNRAAKLLATEDFGISYQVVMELWVVATRKMAKKVPPAKLAAFIEKMLVFPCVHGSEDLYRQAFQLSTRYQVHPYDAAILAAAHELGAKRVFSEDMSHGQVYNEVTVINPFLGLD